MSPRLPRVLVIVNTVTPYTSAVYTSVAKKRSVDLTVLYCSEGHLNRPEHWRGLRRGYQSEVLSGIHLYLRGDAYDPYHLNASVIRRIAEHRPDVVVSQGYGDPTTILAVFACKAMGIPYVLAVDGGDPSSIPRIAQLLVRSIVHGAEAFIAGSPGAELLLCFLGAPPGRIFRLPVASDLARIHTLAMRLRVESSLKAGMREEAKRKTILFVGRLVPEKGIADLVEAFLRLHQGNDNLRMLIVGRGPLKKMIPTVFGRDGSQAITVVDYLEEAELVRKLVTADVLVLPSRKEPFGLVALEGFVSGIPVVVSDACGCKDSAPASSRMTIFPAGNVDLLVKSISEALGHSAASWDSSDLQEVTSFLGENSPDRCAEQFERAVRAAI